MTLGSDSKTVLIVEDDPATAELEKRVLSRSGMSTRHVSCCKDALLLLETQPFAAILLDYHLPDGNPWAVVAAAEAKQPRIPVVLVTGQGTERIASEALQHGVADYVNKTDAFWDQLPGIVARVAQLAKADETLRRMEDFFERANIGAAIRGPDGTLQRVNQAFAEMHGFSTTELIGTSVATVFAPEWRAKLPALFRATEDKGGLRFEAEHVRRDGSVFPVIVDATAVRDAAGNFIFGAAYVQDVTEQRRAEARLRASEEKARAVLDALPDLMFRLNAEGIYQDYRAPLSDELYVPADTLAGRHVADVWPPALADQLLGCVQKTLQTRVIQAWEYRLPLPRGLQDYEARMVACGADEVVVLVRNVTAVRQAERITRASLRGKETLLQEIHHRVNNNLQVIASLLNLQVHKSPDAEVRAALQETRGRIQAIALLHERLYRSGDFSRIDVREYVESVVRDVERANARPNAGIQIVVSAEALGIDMDTAVPLGLIVNELVTNAFKHAFPIGQREGGRIEVRVQRGAGTLRLTVSDDGIGIPAGVELGPGESIGMALVKSLSQQLDGKLTLERQDGLRCTLDFPCPAQEGA